MTENSFCLICIQNVSHNDGFEQIALIFYSVILRYDPSDPAICRSGAGQINDPPRAPLREEIAIVCFSLYRDLSAF